MIYPESDNLEQWGSKYALVALAAKRAKQIKNGAPVLVQTHSKNPLTIALEEIAAGKITCKVSEDDMPEQAPVEPGLTGILPLPIDAEEESDQLEAELDAVELSEDEEAEEAHEEGYVDEEEEHDSVLDHEDVWKDVLHEESEEDVVHEPAPELDPEVVTFSVLDETDEPASKSDRQRKIAAEADALAADLMGPADDQAEIEADEDQIEKE